jgi:hypothetical protein
VVAEIRQFLAKPKGPIAPKRLTKDERAEWDRIIESLEFVGMLPRTNRLALIRFVKRSVRSHGTYQDFRAVGALTSKLRTAERRLSGADQRTVRAARVRLEALWCDLGTQQVRDAEAMLRFCRRHRLTPRSRQEEESDRGA